MSYFEGAAISVRPFFRPAGRRLAIILGALHENAFGLIANMLTRSFPCRHIERHRWIAEALDDGLSLTAIVENVKFNWIFRQRASFVGTRIIVLSDRR